MYKLLSIAALLAITGCASTEKRENGYIQQAANTCLSLGYVADSAGVMCVEREFNRLRDKRARNNRVMGAAVAKGMKDYGDTMRRQQCHNNPYC